MKLGKHIADGTARDELKTSMTTSANAFIGDAVATSPSLDKAGDPPPVVPAADQRSTPTGERIMS